MPPEPLVRLIAAETAQPVPASIQAIAEAARARHGTGIIAVLFYGSCLRAADDRGRIVDLYLLADHYGNVHDGRSMRLLNRLLPPNVYYLETPFEGRRVRAKYAVVTLDQLESLVGPRTLQPYFWARFAQPTRLVWASDPATALRVHAALAQAVVTLLGAITPTLPPKTPPAELWSQAFARTFQTELRAEPPGRAVELQRADAERYERVLSAAGYRPPVPVTEAQSRRSASRWRRRRLQGKCLSALRLVKAAFTFQDGADYLAWKIERHSGVRLELTPWQRRHPILASPALFWRVYRAGGVR